MIKFCYHIGPWIGLLHKLDFISHLLEANTDERYRTGGRIFVQNWKNLGLIQCPECDKLLSLVIQKLVPIGWKIFLQMWKKSQNLVQDLGIMIWNYFIICFINVITTLGSNRI